MTLLGWNVVKPELTIDKVHLLPVDVTKYCRPASVAHLDAHLTRDQEVAVSTPDQEVMGLTPAKVGNILSWRLSMKYFLRSFSPFCWFKKGSCQFLVKEWAQYWLTA